MIVAMLFILLGTIIAGVAGYLILKDRKKDENITR